MIFKVNHFEEVHHRVAIAGTISDRVTQRPIANAVVQIETMMVGGKPLQTLTRADGFFVFLDLAVGQYPLNVTAPSAGSRYGFTTVAIAVSAQEPNRKITVDAKANVQLSPTHLTGIVQRSDTNQAIANALVQVMGNHTQTLTDQDGRYLLSGMQAGNPTIQVSANRFVTVKQQVVLTKGQVTNQNFLLTSN